MSTKINLLIVGNENPDESGLWINACKKQLDKVNYRIVDLSKNNWLEEIQKEPFDFVLTKPPGHTTKFKQLYDERIYILTKTLGHSLYPNLEEILIYENKRFLSFWLKANNIPHPSTQVFYDKKDALSYIQTAIFPIVAKVNIGASGSGVQILKTQHQAHKYINDTFSGKGAKQRVGPNLEKGGLFKRGLHYVFHPKDIGKKLKIYRGINKDKQSDFVIFQNFISHNFEWRVVRIGDSFFAHKKIVKKEKASGSLIKGYENPPLDLLNFVKQITDKHKMYSQAVDVFECDGAYLVNEMQCIFGQSDPYQMKVDNKIGRYLFINSHWIFEEGDYNTNECYDLRLNWVISQK